MKKHQLGLLSALILIPGGFLLSGAIFGETPRTRPSRTISFAGSYTRIAIKTQQLAQENDYPPSWIDVGPARVVENWLESDFTTPGIDGRLGHFSPPKRIRIDGRVFELDQALGEPRISDGERTDRYREVPLAVLAGEPPEGYVWVGKVREVTGSEVVSWVQDWRYLQVE